MNWRRGLLFAMIHLCILIPIIIWRDSDVWRFLRKDNIPVPAVDQTSLIGFEVDYWQPLQEKIVAFANLPAYLVTQWHDPNSSRYAPANFCQTLLGWRSRIAFLAAETIFIALVFLQWLLVGGLPVVHPKHRWLEPGTLITICAGLTLCALAIPFGQDVAIPFMLLSLATWLVWFVIALFKLARSACRSAASRLRAA